ncbi:sugar phosphate isomerase/epimerase family protein [Embleya hyalina]|uniref:Sugar phosphate isomerase n=1 Tax=Embleya hyalina TaxID=516124 RepID=A0A401YNN7_9ACTN|nr:sugar phosphate isomerase/epimerase [Embleya hyalina]GCD96119.1 sugar phosphate isomerase [Embleya hyalina]
MSTPFAPTIAGSTLPLPPRPATDSALGDLRADLRRFRAAGFRHMDLVDTWIAPADLTPRQLRTLADELADHGITLVGLSVIRRSIVDPVHAADNHAYTRRSIEAAAALGAPILSIGFHRPLTDAQRDWGTFWSVPGPTDGEQEFIRAVPALTELCALAADLGVELSLELYEDTLVGTGARTMRLIEATGAANLGVNADLANLHRAPRPLEETWDQTLDLVLDRMNYWHVKNYRRVENHPHGPYLAWPTPLADGDIDYRAALHRARAAGYAGPLCVEHYGGDALTAQTAGLRYLTDLLETM